MLAAGATAAREDVGAIQRTSRPIVTGQSVIAIRYKDGIMMAADTQLCYGNQQKFKDIQRLFPVHQSRTLLGFSGEYSDVQHILKLITEMEYALRACCASRLVQDARFRERYAVEAEDGS